MERMVALLRGINVGGRSLPMADLRALCTEIGLTDVATYIQSGNIVFSTDAPGQAVAAELEESIERRFAMKVPTIVRTATEWRNILAANPFPDVARETPNWLLLMVGKTAPPQGIETAMEATRAKRFARRQAYCGFTIRPGSADPSWSGRRLLRASPWSRRPETIARR
jgi:uncharacterized protein (DUF1697 family)